MSATWKEEGKALRLVADDGWIYASLTKEGDACVDLTRHGKGVLNGKLADISVDAQKALIVNTVSAAKDLPMARYVRGDATHVQVEAHRLKLPSAWVELIGTNEPPKPFPQPVKPSPEPVATEATTTQETTMSDKIYTWIPARTSIVLVSTDGTADPPFVAVIDGTVQDRHGNIYPSLDAAITAVEGPKTVSNAGARGIAPIDGWPAGIKHAASGIKGALNRARQDPTVDMAASGFLRGGKIVASVQAMRLSQAAAKKAALVIVKKFAGEEHVQTAEAFLETKAGAALVDFLTPIALHALATHTALIPKSDLVAATASYALEGQVIRHGIEITDIIAEMVAELAAPMAEMAALGMQLLTDTNVGGSVFDDALDARPVEPLRREA